MSALRPFYSTPQLSTGFQDGVILLLVPHKQYDLIKYRYLIRAIKMFLKLNSSSEFHNENILFVEFSLFCPSPLLETFLSKNLSSNSQGIIFFFQF